MKKRMIDYLNKTTLAPAPPLDEAEWLCDQILNKLADARIYPRSIAAADRSVYFLGRRGEEKCLGIVSLDADKGSGFQGHTERTSIDGVEMFKTMAPVSSRSAAILRDRLPFLKARPLGLKKSA
ncbi:MAG: hypothetical protein GY859_27440, partial [Desulfobacterales bacterium]|nr:hypothetical protein [Desulfobacterales bacterium]